MATYDRLAPLALDVCLHFVLYYTLHVDCHLNRLTDLRKLVRGLPGEVL